MTLSLVIFCGALVSSGFLPIDDQLNDSDIPVFCQALNTYGFLCTGGALASFGVLISHGALV